MFKLSVKKPSSDKLQKIIDDISGPRAENPETSNLPPGKIFIRTISSTKTNTVVTPNGGLGHVTSTTTHDYSSQEQEAHRLNNQGIELQLQGKSEEAFKCFKKAIQICPSSKYAYYNLGNLYRENNQPDKAIVYFLEALSIDDTEITFYNSLAEVYLITKQFSKAEQMLKNARSIDPEDISFLINYGAFLHASHKFKESAKYHKELLSYGRIHSSEQPIIALLNYNLAFAFGQTQQNKKAIRLADEFLSKPVVRMNRKLRAYFIQARVKALQNQKKYTEAIDNLSFVLTQNPADVTCLLELGNTYRMMKRYKDAITIYRRALQYVPKNPVILKAIHDIETEMLFK